MDTGKPPPPPTAKKPASLRRNSFSATELSTLQSLDDNLVAMAGGTIDNRRITWYDGIKEVEDCCESAMQQQLRADDDEVLEEEEDHFSFTSSASDGSSACDDGAHSLRQRKQQQSQQRRPAAELPVFYITPPSPCAYSRSFSTDVARKASAAAADQQHGRSSAGGGIDRLSAAAPHPISRKTSDPNVVTQTSSSYSSAASGHSLQQQRHTARNTLGLLADNHPNHHHPINHHLNHFHHQPGLGFHASASAALRRSHRGPTSSASVVALSAYDKQLAKRSNMEQVMEIQHPMKGTLTHMQGLMDSAFALMGTETIRSIVEGANLASEVLAKAWMTPKNGRLLAHNLCDFLREAGYLELLINLFCDEDSPSSIRESCGEVLEQCVHAANRAYMVSKGFLEDVVKTVVSTFNKDGRGLRIGVTILERLFVDHPEAHNRLIKLGTLDYILDACKKTANDSSTTFRHAALALVNLSMSADNACQQAMISKNVPEWLFFVASCNDDIPRYYACIAICALVSNKEIEAAVIKSGTLSIVEPFLLAHQPSDFAQCDYRYSRVRPKEWLQRLVPMLNGKRPEPRSVAAFHFALEAESRKYHGQPLSVLEEIGAIDALKRAAALPEEVAPIFASQALRVIGEPVPYKLSQRVPEWTVEDVRYWVCKTGFDEYSTTFSAQQVDGDLLLLLTEEELAGDIGMKSGLMRKRFLRELNSLKMIADYRTIDDTKLDHFLVSIHPSFSMYTYRLLEMGVDRSVLPLLDEEVLKNDCYITNPVHRAILLQALEAQTNIDDVELALLSKKIDIFISYRRSTGNQLASLIKVLLQLRGYKVFIDVERLPAGQFDYTLLKNIQAAKHFVLVLTPGSLDRCIGDETGNDWVHKEVLCALENEKNIIPVFDTNFDFPEESSLPADMRAVTKFNGLHWVHEYQDACVDKLEKFISGECIDSVPFPFNRLSSARRSASKLSISGSCTAVGGTGGGLVSSASANDLLGMKKENLSCTSHQSIAAELERHR